MTSNMVRVIKYKGGKRFIKDTKTGRSWRVPEKEGKEKQSRERKESERKTPELLEKKIKKRRFRPGTVALEEICNFERLTGFLIRKLPFTRWMREITQQLRDDLRFQTMALLTLQEAVEVYVVNCFKNTNLSTEHVKRVTLMPKDIQLACRIWGDKVKYVPV